MEIIGLKNSIIEIEKKNNPPAVYVLNSKVEMTENRNLQEIEDWNNIIHQLKLIDIHRALHLITEHFLFF